MRPRILLLTALFAASAPALAGHSVDKVRAQVVNSMAVSGTIEINAQGKVMRYTLVHPEAYSQGVRDLIDRNIPRWTFNPVLVDGAPRAVRADMYLRLQATPVEGDTYQVQIASAAFGNDEDAGDVGLKAGKLTPPSYPRDENLLRISGKVLVVVRIGPDGKVADAVVEQTNLQTLGTEAQVKRWRHDFEHETLAAIRHWTFIVPTTGKQASAGEWFARIPVQYTPWGASTGTALGHWESYIPGPRHPLPWSDPDADRTETADAGIDALPGGGVFPLHQELQLQTPLNAG